MPARDQSCGRSALRAAGCVSLGCHAAGSAVLNRRRPPRRPDYRAGITARRTLLFPLLSLARLRRLDEVRCIW